MTDKKYTNEDIISSLEVIATTCNCNECKIRNGKWGTCNCSQTTANAALDLVNRQESEIGRLQKEVNLVSIQFQDLQERTDEIKAKAYKEFAEKLQAFCKGIITQEWNKKAAPISWSCAYEDFIDDIDNLLKEMVSEEE